MMDGYVENLFSVSISYRNVTFNGARFGFVGSIVICRREAR